MYYLMLDLWLVSLILYLGVMVSVGLDQVLGFESIIQTRPVHFPPRLEEVESEESLWRSRFSRKDVTLTTPNVWRGT